MPSITPVRRRKRRRPTADPTAEQALAKSHRDDRHLFAQCDACGALGSATHTAHALTTTLPAVAANAELVAVVAAELVAAQDRGNELAACRLRDRLTQLQAEGAGTLRHRCAPDKTGALTLYHTRTD